MPDVIDICSYREAQAKLTAMGFLVGDPKYITGEKDWVYGVECNGKSLAAGDRVSIEDKIVLQIGSGQRDANDSVVVTDAVYVNMPERGDVNGGEVDNFVVVE
jgi:beta-lactam-binding protein with PASTA domain